MNISYNWLKEYVPTTHNVQEVADLLTFSGLEVEAIEPIESVKGGLEKYVIGKVLTCIAHPNSDHLHITTIDIGLEEPLHIVCGAPNVAEGQIVVVATIGAKVYDGDECFEIKKSKLRGEPSEGMICSEKELQLGSDNSGIMVLPNGTPGTPAKEYFHLKQDFRLEIGLTANRSDATSHLGVGRDLVAILASQKNENVPLNTPSVDDFKADTNDNDTKITIDPKLCSRYSSLLIKGVKVEDSPKWMQEHLMSVGIRPINNIVDATNFVLYEVGQPLHAFDYDTIDGKEINVKTLEKDTKFVTLDDIERKLTGKEAMICSATKPMCLGGIFGGKDSGITNQTKNILLESAYFNPVVIRKAAKYHQLSTDASFRYERGCDPNITIYALKRVAMLIKEIAGGQISNIIDVYPNPVANAEIDLQYSYLDSIVGKQIPREKIFDILKGLNIAIKEKDDKHLVAIIPTNKVDVLRPCDLVEEILRIYGYNNVEFPSEVHSSLSYSPVPDKEKIQYLITSYLSDNGFNEIMNNSLTSISYYENNIAFPIEKAVKLINPLSSDLALMRQTLLFSGLEVIAFNINRKENNLKIFEFGNVYQKNLNAPDNLPVDKRYLEEKHLSLFVTGKRYERTWQDEEKDNDFFYLKNIVINVLKRLRIDISKISQIESKYNYFSSQISLVNSENKKIIAVLGSINRELIKKFDIKQPIFYADINWNNVIKMLPKKEVQYTNISKFPSVKRDLALVIDRQITFEEIEKIILAQDKSIIKKVSLFDEYNKLTEPNKKQYAVSIVLQDENKTLTDKQIEKIMSNITSALNKQVGAVLR